jgi:DUF1009 family protein
MMTSLPKKQLPLPDQCLGIVAGTGNLIHQLIEVCETQGRSFFILAFEDQTDPTLVANRPHAWVKLAKVGHNLDILRQAGVTQIVMAGRFRRPSWRELLQPDFTGAKWLATLSGQVLGDDGALRIIIHLLEQEGFSVVSPESIIGNKLFISQGVISKIHPSETAWQDIERGRQILDHLSSLDIGQAIVIQQGLTLGIEAIEGTDELIKRCGQYSRPGPGPVLIKMCKQDQETRIDRATVGCQTIERLIASGFSGMAVGANSVIVLEQRNVIARANSAGLFVVGI